MARITVEDCLEKIPNRFELILLAARRARQISHGGKCMVAEEHDKPAVLALREIAEGYIDMSFMEERKPEKEDIFMKADADLVAGMNAVKEVAAKVDDMREIELATTQTVADVTADMAETENE